MSPAHHTTRHSYPRAARINALLHEVLAEALTALGDSDERLSLITVTAVNCDPDLRHARVYLASMNEPAKAALGERRKQLQAMFARQVRMKRVPVLSFEVDPAILAGSAVEQALQRVRESSPSSDEELPET